jgi:hypothetical protein
MPLEKESKAEKENRHQWVKTEIHKFFVNITAVNTGY